MRMKVVAGLGSIDDYDAYADAGADELFIGYVPYEWLIKYEQTMPLNRREVSFVNVNIGSYSELEILAEKVRRRGVPVSIAFNGLNYSPQSYMTIINIIRECIKLDMRDIIVADIGLLVHLRENNLCDKVNIHISGEFGRMNSYEIMALQDFNIKRIIYPRGTNIKDITAMSGSFKELEHEVFFLNEKCHFEGAYCNSLHCDELVPMCRMPYVISTLVDNKDRGSKSTDIIDTDAINGKNPKHIDRQYTDGLDSDDIDSHEDKIDSLEGNIGFDGCGLCALKLLESNNVTHLKIVGRGAVFEDMIRSISIARKAVELSRNIKGEDTYRDYIKNQLMQGRCGQNCYYLINK